MPTELTLGDEYTCRYSKVTGPAVDIVASAGGCYMIGLQMPPKDGERGKTEYVMDTYLEGDVACPQSFKDRAALLLQHRFRDTISKMEGICDAVRFMLNGTEQLAIQPEMTKKHTDMPKSYYVDSNHCEQLDVTRKPEPVKAAPRTGPPTSRAHRF